MRGRGAGRVGQEIKRKDAPVRVGVDDRGRRSSKSWGDEKGRRDGVFRPARWAAQF